MSDDAVKARLVAAREALGLLELEGMRAIQSAQRCIARGAPVYGVEVAALEALIAGMRVAAEMLRAGWSARAGSEPRAATVECFACARAARDGNGPCLRCALRCALREAAQ